MENIVGICISLFHLQTMLVLFDLYSIQQEELKHIWQVSLNYIYEIVRKSIKAI